MISELERHFSVVSLLLLAGAGLIIFQGPVGEIYGQAAPPAAQSAHPKPAANSPNAAKPLTAQASVTKSTWVTAADGAKALQPTVLGEIPLNAKPAASSK